MPLGNDLQFGIVISADGSAAIRTLDRTEDAVERLGRGTDSASRSTRRYADATDRAEQASRRQVGTLAQLRGALVAAGTGFAALRLADFVRDVAAVGTAWQSVRSGMVAATGSAAAAAAELEFVSAEAERLGLSNRALAQSYTRLAASARGTVLEGAAARDIFTAVAEASRVMGLSAEQSAGALTAIEQIISKGTVSAEELRGQLGERIPGAFQIAARAIGVTTAELDEMLRRGEVLAEDLLPRLAAEIRRSVADGLPDAIDGAGAAFARLGNAWEDLQRSIAESGVLDVLAAGAELATSVLRGGAAQAPSGIDVAERDLGLALDRGDLDAAEVYLRILGDLNAALVETGERSTEIADRTRLVIESWGDLRSETGLLAEDMASYQRALAALVAIEGERRDDQIAASFEAAAEAEAAAWGDVGHAIGEVTAAHAAEAEAREASRRSDRAYLEALREEAELIGASALARRIAVAERRLSADATAAQRAEVRDLVTALHLEESAVGTAVDGWGDYAEAVENAAEHRRRSARASEELIEGLEREVRLVGLGGRERFIESRVGRLGDLASEDDIARVRELAGALYDARDAASEVASEGRTIDDAFRRVADGIHGGFTDAFEDILEDGRLSFESLGDGILGAFRRMLAEMATLALAQPVIIPVVTTIGGALGLSPGAIGGLTGSLGGGSPLLGGGGLLGGLNNLGSGLLGTGGAGGASVLGPGWAGWTTAPLSTLLGVGALGFGLGGALGLNTGGQIGGGLGSAIGFGLGGPFGAILGGLGGGLLGSLFGGGGGPTDYADLRGVGRYELGPDRGANARLQAIGPSIERLAGAIDALLGVDPTSPGALSSHLFLGVGTQGSNILGFGGTGRPGGRTEITSNDPEEIVQRITEILGEWSGLTEEQLRAGVAGVGLADAMREQIAVQEALRDAAGLTTEQLRAQEIAEIAAKSGSEALTETLQELHAELTQTGLEAGLRQQIALQRRRRDAAGLDAEGLIRLDIETALETLGDGAADARAELEPLIQELVNLTTQADAAAAAAQRLASVQSIREDLQRQIQVLQGGDPRQLAIDDLRAQIEALGPEGAAAADELSALLAQIHALEDAAAAAAAAAAEQARQEAEAERRRASVASLRESLQRRLALAQGGDPRALELQDLRAQIAALGPEGAAAAAGLRSLLEQIHAAEDLAGARSFLEELRASADPAGARLRELVDAFAELRRHAGELGVSLEEVARLQDDALAGLRSSVQAQLGGLADQARRILGLDTLEALRSDIDARALAALPPQAQLEQLRADFNAAVLAAIGGEAGAAQEASDLGRLLLELSSSTFASGPQAQELVAGVRDALDRVIAAQESRLETLGPDIVGQLQVSTDEQIRAIAEQTRALTEVLQRIEQALPGAAV